MKDFPNVYKMYYALPGNGAGGNLHLVLDDGNCDDSALWTCIQSCVENKDKMGLWIASNMLFTMTEEQREQVYCEMHDIDYNGWIQSINDAAERETERTLNRFLKGTVINYEPA